MFRAAMNAMPWNGRKIKRFLRKREFPEYHEGEEREHGQGSGSSGRFRAKPGNFQEKLLSAYRRVPNT